jgi:hypothetical protein
MIHHRLRNGKFDRRLVCVILPAGLAHRQQPSDGGSQAQVNAGYRNRHHPLSVQPLTGGIISTCCAQPVILCVDQLAVLALVLLLSSLGCSLGQTLVGDPTPTPTRVSLPPLPTWTPLPPGQLPPAAVATLTVEAAVNLPTLTPTPLPTPTSTPIADTPTPLPTPTPVPYVEVLNQNVNVRQGPSLAYPIVGQATAGDLYDIIGRNEASTWWKVCCYDGQEVWIFATRATTCGGGSASARRGAH